MFLLVKKMYSSIFQILTFKKTLFRLPLVLAPTTYDVCFVSPSFPTMLTSFSEQTPWLSSICTCSAAMTWCRRGLLPSSSTSWLCAWLLSTFINTLCPMVWTLVTRWEHLHLVFYLKQELKRDESIKHYLLKVVIKSVEKECGGLERFVPSSLTESMKKKVIYFLNNFS